MYQAPFSASISRVERHEIGKHDLGVGEQIRVSEMAREIGERSTDVGGNHAEERLRRGGEEADPEFLVKEEGRNVGAVQDVLEVVGEGLMLVEGLLKLAIERRKLLVERLQFLLGGFEFLVGGLELLVHRHRFFVDRPDVLFGGLTVADGVLEFLARGIELLLDLSDPRGVGWRLDHRFGSLLVLRHVEEADQNQFLAVALHRLGADGHRDGTRHCASPGQRWRPPVPAPGSPSRALS